MRNLKCSLLPGLPILLPFRLYSLVFKCHACADPEGRGVGGPDPIPGKSQVLSNSTEISIWTPLVNSWTPPRIPGKFWTKNPKTNIKNQRLFSRRWAWTRPPPLSDKKIWICACIDHSTAHPPGSPNVRRNYMVMSVPWLNYPLTIEALTVGGGGG